MKIRDLVGIIVENELVEIHQNSRDCCRCEFGKIPSAYLDNEIEGMCSLPCSREYNSYTYIQLK